MPAITPTLARMLDRAGVEQTILVGHSLGALVAAAFAAKYPQRVLYLVLADVAQGYGQAEAAQREKVWQGRQQQIALGGEAMARGELQNCCALARAKPMWRRWRRGCAGYAATVISPRPGCWPMTTFTVGSPTIAVVSPCGGEQDAITQPELVQGGRCVTAPLTSPSLRLDMPAISITKSFLIKSFYA